MKRLIITLVSAGVMALGLGAAPSAAATNPDYQWMDGGGGCHIGSLDHRHTHRWHAYLDGGGYWYVWTDVYLCVAPGYWSYVGGFRNS